MGGGEVSPPAPPLHPFPPRFTVMTWPSPIRSPLWTNISEGDLVNLAKAVS